MFVHVNYDWHMSHDDGSTDFSDDETLDDHPRANGLRTPEKVSPSDKLRTLNSGQTGNLSVFHSPNNNNSPDRKDYFANTSDWSRSTPSDQGADSPGSYRIMPPPPPPQHKKPSLCKSKFCLLYVYNVFFNVALFVCSVSGSNLASHMVGSLKKGSKQSMSLPSTAYNTLPAHVHQMRSSPRVISGSSSSNKKASSQYHKRSPSSDSGTGSNTPVSSYHSGKVHHTVFLHGKSIRIPEHFMFYES